MGKFIDLTGQQFGELTVIERDLIYPIEHKLSSESSWWKCQCGCGKIVRKASYSLRRGKHPSCGCYKPILATQAKNLTDQIFGCLKVLYPIEKRASNGQIIWHCKCLNCGTELNVRTSHLTAQKQISCGCINSIGEYYIKKILNQNNIKFINQYTFKDLKSEKGKFLKYDFYLPSYNRLIEFDGEQHFNNQTDDFWYHDTSYEKRLKYDKIKNEYALSHNIPLVRIPYWERNNITLELILEDKYLIK